MRVFVATLWALVLTAGAALMEARPSAAQEHVTGTVRVDRPTANPTPGGRNITAAYMTLHNGGPEPDRLVSATSPLAGRVEIHATTRDANGTMRMEHLADGLALPVDGTVTLQRGGLHIMLFDLNQPLVEGDELPLTLTFARGGVVSVVAMVERPTMQAASGGHHH